MKKLIALVIVFAFVVTISNAFAGTSAGSTEVGLAVSMSRTSIDYDGGSVDVDTLMALTKIGYFFTDEFSLALAATGTVVSVDAGDDAAQGDAAMLALQVQPDWHFVTDGMWVPYVGPHAGIFMYEAGDFSDEVISYGAHIGAKGFVTENVAVDLSLRYTIYEVDAGEDSDVEVDEIMAFAGLNFYF